MNHDGQINRGCPSQNGFIMAPSDVHTPQQFDWSLCSLNDLQNFVKYSDFYNYSMISQLKPVD